MATRGYRTGDERSGDGIYRCVGSLTISRAATTEREIDLMPDGMTIDLTGVERMDTVGAWLIYRATRDRGAKLQGASREVEGLLEQVHQADHPVRVIPEEEGTGFRRTVAELGEYVV
jgi:phospholipid/cholesterol/gamma-HCH transport system permease protein